ncbi:Caf20p NDAI_0E00880 [Naumovozyma dairenensis CBS 421]|uniref:Cap-associated protein CAF20 n=1 Tax=Naumovozyma dairenensis (strain ATCC 10597 / BCRC 20456 / CBS 421 / NBRC 0211 / NRRL Y-12639) TaxID=1071378 RepID=G0WAY4_NAUDC|nr:hypothetical protein NDAI_0E00880 [Naumovozyma dairenensis CBS 421]CCD24904.1 hypothetical protein NDAI_0E00880 [Naumovozyma dairenensis CBS 421]
MYKYTIDELLQLKPSETLVANFDAVDFRAIIEKVKQLQSLKEEEFAHHGGHGHFNRRRSSHHHAGRPKVKHNKPKVTTDSEGWSTLDNKKDVAEESEVVDGATTTAAGTTSNGNTRSSPVPSATIAQETLKVRPNNKNIGSSRPADTKDIVADKQIHGFNAFAALESDEDDE